MSNKKIFKASKVQNLKMVSANLCLDIKELLE